MTDLHLDSNLVQEATHLAQKMHQREICLYLTGLAASGKSAVAGVVSRLTGVPLVDSGLPFRLAAYLCKNVPVLVADMTLLDKLLNAHSIRVISGEYHIFSGEEDITERLKSQDIDWGVPIFAGNVRIRELVLRFLRSTTTAPAIVAARGATEPLTSGHILQIELRAHFDVRVNRRIKQGDGPHNTVRRSLRQRDERDLHGPSRYPSPDIIDTTHLTLEEAAARVIARANERIDRVYSFLDFRRRLIPEGVELENPLLNKAWECTKDLVANIEDTIGVPQGHSKGRFLLHLSRFSAQELFGPSAIKGCEWPSGTFPPDVPESNLMPNNETLNFEAERIVKERFIAIEEFFRSTRLPRSFLTPVRPTQLYRHKNNLIAKDEDGNIVEYLDVRDASRELGVAIEEYLHYLGIERADTTHRIVLVEKSTDLPVLYISFAPNTRKYTEPLLWAFGLRMEEVAVAVRGFGSPRCPKNAMGLFLRTACKRVANDFPHLKAILTDINPNWGFTGSSFREAGFIDIGLKHAPTSFIGDEYASRRSLEGQKGRKAAMPNRMSLVPTLIMLRPLHDVLRRHIESVASDGLYIIPQNLYNKETI